MKVLIRIAGFLLLALLISIPFAFRSEAGALSPLPTVVERIDGVNYVAPPRRPGSNPFEPIREIQAEWVSIIPYAFLKPDDPEVTADHPWQWWGETSEGAAESIVQAREKGLKIMLKPHVWVKGQGWAGDFSCQNESDWLLWEESYSRYVLNLARLAHTQQVELLCIGTEFRQAVRQRPEYWPELIQEIRKVYQGKLTYAANWDNYQQVNFWDQLDYIGIDAYFPLAEGESPSVQEIEAAWKPHLKELKAWCRKTQKPMLFTEYGYCSVDFATKEPWSEDHGAALNLEVQQNAYEALYRSFWGKGWVAGGFLWKWYDRHETSGGSKNKGFTPQNKPAEITISRWYGS